MRFAGGCTCGAVRYAVEGPLRDVIVCHCVDCLEAAGRPWGATAVRRSDLSVDDPGMIRWVHAASSDHDASRGLCVQCGTVVFWDAPTRDTVSLGADTLDSAPDLVVAAHIWVEHDRGWAPSDEELAREVPSYPRGSSEAADAPVLRWVT
jgi:hypothetical protein